MAGPNWNVIKDCASYDRIIR